jgi:hypothetical protein
VDGQLYCKKQGNQAIIYPGSMSLMVEVEHAGFESLRAGRSLQERCLKTKESILGGHVENERASKYYALQTTEVSVRFSNNRDEILKNAQAELDSRKLTHILEFPSYRIQILRLPRTSLVSLHTTTSTDIQDLQEKLVQALDGRSVNMSLAQFCDVMDPDFRLQGVYEAEGHNFLFNLRVNEEGRSNFEKPTIM